MRLARSRLAAVLALTAAVLTVTACGDDPDDLATAPTASPSTSSGENGTANESPQPTPTRTRPEFERPEVPPEMLVDDHTGATAATWYFLELLDYMRATGETAQWEAMTTDECGWCDTAVEQVSSVYGDGGRIEGADLRYDISTAMVELPVQERPFYAVILEEATEKPSRIVYADGTVLDQEARDMAPLEVGVRFVNGRFLIVGINYEVA